MNSEGENKGAIPIEGENRGAIRNEGKNRAVNVDQQQNQYGTFQGVANYPPPRPPRPHHQSQQPTIGFPQPTPPPYVTHPRYYAQGYQTVPDYAVAEGRPVREQRLPCCGIGVGWFLFITGFFFGAIPWYIGVLVLLCSRIDYREKPGYISCTIAANWFQVKRGKFLPGIDVSAILATVAIILGVTRENDEW